MPLSRGSLEMLAIVDTPGISGRARMLCLLEGLLGRRYRTAKPVVARRRHLRALGLVEATSRGEALTHAGRRLLDDRAPEVCAIRDRIDELLDDELELASARLDSPPLNSSRFIAKESLERPPRERERVDLTAADIRPHLSVMELPDALLPRDDAARFELAVLLRLVESLAARLGPAGFTLHRTLILAGRREVAWFARGDHHLRIHYNQACLETGPYDASLRRYLGQQGRLRPDVTVIVEAPGAPPRAAVIEAKLSADPSYLAQGLQEAFLYRAEFAAHLRGWPKSILVASSPLPGEPRREDDVVAVGWDRWVPEPVIDGLVEGLVAAREGAFG